LIELGNARVISTGRAFDVSAARRLSVVSKETSMSINNANYSGDRLKARPGASPRIDVKVRPGQSRRIERTRLPILLAAIAVLCAGFLPESASAQQYTAFYYNAKGELLQVEAVPNGEISRRTLENADTTKMVIPMLNSTATPKVTGPNRAMSKFATIAVYYTVSASTTPQTGAQDVQAKPVKVEDLQWVKERVLATCLTRLSTSPCLFPKRCHCMTGSCCCY
jgi:hypothetical protein